MAKRIMIVDDSATVRAAVGAELRGSGYRVMECDSVWISGHVQDFRPDLILLDVTLRGGTLGTTAAASMRGKTLVLGTKIVLYSSVANLSELAKTCGADGWIPKSVVGKDLVKMVDSFLGLDLDLDDAAGEG